MYIGLLGRDPYGPKSGIYIATWVTAHSRDMAPILKAKPVE